MNARTKISWALVTVLSFCLVSRNEAEEGVDLNQRYPSTLDTSRDGYDWTCDSSDVWRVSEFSYSAGDQFKLQLKSATVVLGRHQSSVLWAVVIPDGDGELVKSNNGQGEHVTSV